MINDKLKVYLFILVSFFPVFALRSNLDLIEIIYSILVFFIPILLINLFFINKPHNNNYFTLYLSMVIVFGIDNNLGLWNGLIGPYTFDFIRIFRIIYIPAFIYLILMIIFIFVILKITDSKFQNVILVFLFTIFIFNVFDQTKSSKNIIEFKHLSNQKYQTTKVVIVFDEMSGLNSYESLNYEKQEFDNYAKSFFKKHNFEFYSNVKSITRDTITSLTSMLNLSSDENIRNDLIVKSNNYFNEYELTQSLFFENFKDISIYQNIHINFCNLENISKCNTYNIFKEKNFIKGFKDNFLTKSISLWKINGSIFSALTWRTLRQLRVIDSTLEPEGEKASFSKLFSKIEEDIYTKNYDLIFVHSLVPHKPYGFDENCNYDGKRSILNKYNGKKKNIEQHNIERRCVLYYLDGFLENLKKNNEINSMNLTILSDHGARIVRGNPSSELSVIYANKNPKTNFKENKQKAISQELFIEQN